MAENLLTALHILSLGSKAFPKNIWGRNLVSFA